MLFVSWVQRKEWINMANIKKYTTKITLDTSHDTSYRFKTEREVKEALINRLERACKDVEKYFDTGHSAKLSRVLTDYYTQQLSAVGVSNYRDLKDDLEGILYKFHKVHNPYQLAKEADVDESYGNYCYNAYDIMRDLQAELNELVVDYCEKAYEFIMRKYVK